MWRCIILFVYIHLYICPKQWNAFFFRTCSPLPVMPLKAGRHSSPSAVDEWLVLLINQLCKIVFIPAYSLNEKLWYTIDVGVAACLDTAWYHLDRGGGEKRPGTWVRGYFVVPTRLRRRGKASEQSYSEPHVLLGYLTHAHAKGTRPLFLSSAAWVRG